LKWSEICDFIKAMFDRSLLILCAVLHVERYWYVCFRKFSLTALGRISAVNFLQKYRRDTQLIEIEPVVRANGKACHEARPGVMSR
jgi:hypothetical protein